MINRLLRIRGGEIRRGLKDNIGLSEWNLFVNGYRTVTAGRTGNSGIDGRLVVSSKAGILPFVDRVDCGCP